MYSVSKVDERTFYIVKDGVKWAYAEITDPDDDTPIESAESRANNLCAILNGKNEKVDSINGVSVSDWAREIAYRVGDECFGVIPHPESTNLLETWLINNPKIVEAMVGTEIIEDDYFETE